LQMKNQKLKTLLVILKCGQSVRRNYGSHI